MRIANWAAAADYINQMYGQGLRGHIASMDSLALNQRGVIEFKVYRGLLGNKDPLVKLLERVSKAHGESYDHAHSYDVVTEYIWNLTRERSVVVGHRKGRGLFIQLKDIGD